MLAALFLVALSWLILGLRRKEAVEEDGPGRPGGRGGPGRYAARLDQHRVGDQHNEAQGACLRGAGVR
eukprot:1624304-Pyramimonas_sp.AAC.2